MGDVVKFESQRITTDEYFGGCPECGQNDGYLNIGRTHVFFCETHETAWAAGSNLFSSWHDETKADWQRNEERLATYSTVEPIYPEPTEEERRKMEEHNVLMSRVDKGYGVAFGPDGPRAIKPHENPFDLS